MDYVVVFDTVMLSTVWTKDFLFVSFYKDHKVLSSCDKGATFIWLLLVHVGIETFFPPTQDEVGMYARFIYLLLFGSVLCPVSRRVLLAPLLILIDRGLLPLFLLFVLQESLEAQVMDEASRVLGDVQTKIPVY